MNGDSRAGRGRVAVVSGAASGVGLATVQVLTDDGCVVIGVDRAERPAALGDAQVAEWVRGDVTERATWDAAAEAARRHDPAGAAVLCACAGIAPTAPFLATGLDIWRQVYDVNVLGVVLGLQVLLPPMIARGGGAVAVVCSVDSLFTEEELGAYAASKAALLQVVRSAALEHARDGLRINAVCPGAVDTPLLHAAFATQQTPSAGIDAVLRRTPTGVLLRAQEVAAVMRFLVSEEASGMSGAAVTVDGGLTTTFDYAPPPS